MGSVKNGEVVELNKVCFEPYDWLNFELLNESEGQKLEVYINTPQETEFIISFYTLLRPLLDAPLIIGPFGRHVPWGDYCIDTWDFENDKYNYDPESNTAPISTYLKMLIQNEVDPSYTGYCSCLTLDRFLLITVDCLLKGRAPYGMMFYAPKHETVIYMHSSFSYGIYYRQTTESIEQVIKIAKESGYEIRNASEKLS